jgi:hypothetical protein
MGKAVMRIAPPLLMFMLGGKFEVVKDAIPNGTKLTGAFYDADRDCFAMILEHESFKDVQVGSLLPELPPVTITRLDE